MSTQTRDTSTRTMEERLGQVGRKIDQAKGKADAATQEAKARVGQRIDALQARKAQLGRRLQQPKHSVEEDRPGCNVDSVRTDERPHETRALLVAAVGVAPDEIAKHSSVLLEARRRPQQAASRRHQILEVDSASLAVGQLGQLDRAHRFTEDGSLDHRTRVDADSHRRVVKFVPISPAKLRTVNSSLGRTRRHPQP